MNREPSKWLYLPVEIRVREFDARLLVACCAAERGYTAVIGMKNAVTASYPVMPRGIIFDRSLSTFREENFQNLVDEGFHLCSNDEETFAFYITPEPVLKQRVSARNLAITDWYFAWGRQQADMISETYPGFDEKILVTGTYRGDLNLPEFQQAMWQTDVDALKQRYGRFILLPSNFSEVENELGGRKFTLDQMFEQGAIHTDEEAAFFEDFLDYKANNLEAYKQAIPAVLEAFPEHQLVIRPHPGETHAHWQAFAEQHDRVVVLHEGAVTPWLIAAEAVFHHGCSTGLETYLLGGASIPFHPVPAPVHDVHLSTRIGPFARTTAELIEYLGLGIEGRPLPRGDIGWLDDYLVVPRDGLISDRIIDAFDRLDVALDHPGLFKRVPQRLKMFLFRRKVALRRSLKKLLGRKQLPSRHTRRWGYLTAEDVAGFIDVFHRATGRFDNLQVDKLYGQVFCIYRR